VTKRSDSAVISSRIFLPELSPSTSSSVFRILSNGAYAKETNAETPARNPTDGKREMTSRQKRRRKRNFHEDKRNSSRSKHDLLRTTGTKNEEDGRERGKKSWWRAWRITRALITCYHSFVRRKTKGDSAPREKKRKSTDISKFISLILVSSSRRVLKYKFMLKIWI